MLDVLFWGLKVTHGVWKQLIKEYTVSIPQLQTEFGELQFPGSPYLQWQWWVGSLVLNTKLIFSSVLRIWIRIDLTLLDQIRFGNADPDSGARKLTKINKQTWFPAFQKSSVADPKLLFRIRYRIRIRPLVSFGFGSGFESGFESEFESGFESWIRIRIQILDLNPDHKQAKTSFF